MSKKSKTLAYHHAKKLWHVDKKGNKLPNLKATPSLRTWLVDEKGKPLPNLKAKLLPTRKKEGLNKPTLLLPRN